MCLGDSLVGIVGHQMVKRTTVHAKIGGGGEGSKPNKGMKNSGKHAIQPTRNLRKI